MKQYLAHIAVVVDDYDAAIDFYAGKLKFTVVEDTVLSETKRWVIVAPPGSNASQNGSCFLLLAKAATDEQKKPDRQSNWRKSIFIFIHG